MRDQVAEFEASNGARANTLARTGDPIVVITSVGARSGKLRKNPVMRVEHAGSYLAVASKGGAPEDPVWAHNFRAHPEVELPDGASTRRRTTSGSCLDGPERDAWWQRAVATWSTYGDYQRRTDRSIPLFLLERRA